MAIFWAGPPNIGTDLLSLLFYWSKSIDMEWWIRNRYWQLNNLESYFSFEGFLCLVRLRTRIWRIWWWIWRIWWWIWIWRLRTRLWWIWRLWILLNLDCGFKPSYVFERRGNWQGIEHDEVLRSLEPHVKYIKTVQFIRLWGGDEDLYKYFWERGNAKKILCSNSSAGEESNYWLDLWEVGIILHLIPSCMADVRCGRIHFIWSHSSICMKSLDLASQTVIMDHGCIPRATKLTSSHHAWSWYICFDLYRVKRLSCCTQHEQMVLTFTSQFLCASLFSRIWWQ